MIAFYEEEGIGMWVAEVYFANRHWENIQIDWRLFNPKGEHICSGFSSTRTSQQQMGCIPRAFGLARRAFARHVPAHRRGATRQY